MPDAEDLYQEEKFEYPLFDKSKRKKKGDQVEGNKLSLLIIVLYKI